MAHRYGIPFARDSAGLVFDRDAIELVPRPFAEPLTCAGCSDTVHPVRGSSRATKRGGTAAMKAHYRLKRGTGHDEGCPYDFDGARTSWSATATAASCAPASSGAQPIRAEIAPLLKLADHHFATNVSLVSGAAALCCHDTPL